MSKKRGNIEVQETFLRSVALPEATDTYTVIAHGTIIDKVREELDKNGFTVDEEKYSATIDGEIALSKVYIKSDKDPDMGMIFTWWNSYNKRVKFGCAVGSFIYDNKASLIGSEGMSWIRLHTGTADVEAMSVVEQLIKAANGYFDKIITEKNQMKAMPLSVEDYGCVMGALYFEHSLITPTQASAVIAERKKPTTPCMDKDNLWGLYKILMFGIEGMDITKWVKSQQKLHHMIMTEYAIIREEENLTIAIDETSHLETPEVLGSTIEPIYQNEDSVGTDGISDVGLDSITSLTSEEMTTYEETSVVNEDVELTIITEEPTPIAEDTISQEMKDFHNHPEAPMPIVESDIEYQERVVAIEGEPEPLPEIVKDSLKESVTAKAHGIVPDEIISEEQIEIIKEERGISNVDEPAIDEDELDLLFTSKTADVLENINEPVEIISPEEMADGLEVPVEITEEAKAIETRMTDLYGSIKPYRVFGKERKLVILDETLECFSI